jgi:glycine betaine/choline ABC-type transport system substrate-binding protein
VRSRYVGWSPAGTILKYANFNNTYGIFMRCKIVGDQNLNTLDGLVSACSNLIFAILSEFQDRSDGYQNMIKNYPGLPLKDTTVANDLGLRH